MNTKAENIKSTIVSQLLRDGFSANGFVNSYSGNSNTQVLENVVVEITVFNYFEIELKIFKSDLNSVYIQYRRINGVIEITDMINLSNSLNNSKPNLIQYY